MKNVKLNIKIKEYLIDVCVISGIFQWINIVWQSLEESFDGGIQPSISDSVIGLALTLILWLLIRKWYVTKE